MASIHPIPSSGKAGLFIVAGLGLGAAMAAGVYWFAGPSPLQANDPAEAQVVAAASAPLPSPAPSDALTVNGIAPPAPEASASAVIADLKQASRALSPDRVHPPFTGPVTERPAYVSPMEWSMLKGLADQHASPPQELTRLVNSLRFNKQLEAWEALPRTPDAALQRRTLATSLVNDLPERVRHQDLGLPDAQRTLGALLRDLEPDAEQRLARAAQEEQRLRQALPASTPNTGQL